MTATAKPLASPVHEALRGDDAGMDFMPMVGSHKRDAYATSEAHKRDAYATGQAATTARLRELMSKAGVVMLAADESRPPAQLDHGGWTEIGQLDSLGHKIGIRLAREIEREVETNAERVLSLIEAGWPRVKIVADRLGFSETESRRAPDRSLRAGQRFPERVLEPPAIGEPGVRHAGTGASWWCAERT